ncbi:MAG TPA: tyrosine-type recombinase/integrase, partial [Bacteroidales bacterium]|nr:tyrosine-type recombinase/integrase [Bacteroidales bacterium]
MKTPHIANNENVIEDYVTVLELLDLKETSIVTRVQSLVPFFNYLESKKAEDVTKSDIEKYITHMRRSKKKKVTQNRDIINIRAFFNWRKPENDYFNNIKIKREKPDNSKKEFVDASDVLKMLPHCTNQRDRVLLMLMWESGARLGELLSINIEDVKPHKHGITVTVTGKTGKRDILIIDSVPDIQQWLNIYKADKEAPLFPIMSRRGKGRLGSRGAEYVISNLAGKAGLEKRVYCHSFRHGRLSELSNAGMSEMQLRHYAGWTDESDMPAVYLHTTQDDVFNKLLKIKGVDIEETKQEPVKIMTNKICPRCKAAN